MTAKDKRRRELARDRYERQEQRRADRDRARRRRQRILVGLVVAALVGGMGIGLVLAIASRDDSPAPPPEDTVAAGSCAFIDNAPDPEVVTDVGRPPSEPGELGPLTATLTLNGTPVVIEMDTEGAPCTAASWQFLAAADYFDDTRCHRLTTSDTLGVLQCGDPSGTGRGGPGYRFAEESTEGATYPAGTVAMANTGAPGSTGSQFFIVHADTELPPSYTVVGQVTEGLEAVTAVAQAGTVDGTDDGEPATEAVIDDLVVERSPR